MSYSCLDYFGDLPTLDVVAICARDTADQAAFRAHGLLAGFSAADPTGRIALLGGMLAGGVVLLRLAAFLRAAGGIVWRARRPVLTKLRQPKPLTLVERHRRKPAEGRIERGDRP